MTEEPLVSVLTPVYNGAEHLDECIQSVLRQTYSNWEYIIVDNNSTDATRQIAENYAARDSRIRVLHPTEFVDIYRNHNRAAQAMAPASKYCKFLQADDWLYPECLVQMVAVAEANPSVGVVSSFRLFGKNVQNDGVFSVEQSVIPGREALRTAVRSTPFEWFTGSPSTVMFRGDLVRKYVEFYDPDDWHADTEAAFRLLLESDLGFVHQVLTFTRHNPGVLSGFTYRVWTFHPLAGRMLIRYGPRVLSPSDFRNAARRWLWSYARWLGKQVLKPARHGQQEFHDFHQKEIDTMLAEAGDARELRMGLLLCRRLLHTPPRLRSRRTSAPLHGLSLLPVL